MSKLGEWLETIGLSRYGHCLAQNDIGFDELSELSDDDLKELGLSIGHRRRFLKAVREIQPTHSPAERRQVTVLFADIVGFTRLSSRLDPEDLLDVINSFQANSTAVIEDYRGTVVKFVGDGLLAFFGWPVASERDAINCVRAATKLSELVGEKTVVNGEPLRIRAGVSTGLAVVGDLASNMPDVFGDVPNLAARLQTDAEPGSVLISEATHRLVGHVFDCTHKGPFDIKGLGETKAWAVAAEMEDTAQKRLSVVDTASIMQGREPELSLLRQTWDTAKKGQFQIACIEAEAGLGKSRLASELIAESAKDSALITLFGSPDAGQRPLRPIANMIERAAKIVKTDDLQEKAEKLDILLSGSALPLSRFQGVFRELCQIPLDEGARAETPERRRALLFEGVKTFIEHRARDLPVLLLIEDLHWLDMPTIELVGLLGEIDQNLPVFMLATTRPERAHPWEDDQCISIRLKALSRSDAEQVLRETLGSGNEVLAGAIRQIIERADGIPLYLEELSRSVHLTLDTLAIPSTLKDSLMARLDRLGEEREIALVASVLGRDIEERLLTEVLAKNPVTVRAGLNRLVDEQVLKKSPSETGDGTQYRFRHALLLEAAYDSQLLRRRREVHSTVADVLLGWLRQEREVSPATLAHHLSRAKRPSEASGYFRQAGQTALASAHYAEAENLLKLALSHLAEAPETDASLSPDSKTAELEIKTELGSVLIAREGFAAPAVGEAFQDAERLGREMGPGPALARALWGSWLYKLVSGDLQRALVLAKELEGLGTSFAELDGKGLITEARWALGNAQFWTADLEESFLNLTKATQLYDTDAHADHALIYGQDPLVAAHCYLGYTQTIRGHHTAAWAAQRAAVRHAKKLSHPFTTAWSLCFPALIATFRKEAWSANHLASVALQHVNDQMMPFWQTAMTMVQGWAVAKSGKPEQGLAQAQAGLDMYCAIGSKTVQPYFRGLVAECQALAGHPEECHDMVHAALKLADETGEHVSTLLLHRIAGELGLAHPETKLNAEKHLRTALTLSKDAGAAAVELDAALGLYKLDVADAPECLSCALTRQPDPTKTRSGRAAAKLLGQRVPVLT